jgi:zinc transport system substrate-binding protein
MQMSCNPSGEIHRRPASIPRLLRSAGLALLLVALAACGRTPAATGSDLIVASFYPLYEFARHVAGDQGKVTLLVPPGTEPHDWEPAPADVVRVQSARIFLYNGGGFESWADRLLDQGRPGGPRVVKAAQGLTSLEAEGHPDPHVWLDPLLARAQVEAIRAALAAVDPGRAEVYGANASAFSRRLLELHERFDTGLARCARREIVVSHAAFAYLAHRYRLVQVPIMGLAPDAEPSPAGLAALTRQAQRLRVTHVFFEALVTPKLAETLAHEIGAKVLVLDPVEGLTKEEERTGVGYIELMDANLKNLETGLGCQ